MDPDEIGIKVTLIGESSVGKTSIINRYTKNAFTQEMESTLGANYSQKKITLHKQKIRMDLWDTAGQEKYRAIGRHFYKESYIVCLVYDITNRDSFEKLKSVWFPELKEYGEKLKILALVGNKLDKYLDEDVNDEEAKKFAEEINAFFTKTSAMEGTNIEDLFNTLAEKYLTDIANLVIEKDEKNIQIKGDDVKDKGKKKKCC